MQGAREGQGIRATIIIAASAALGSTISSIAFVLYSYDQTPVRTAFLAPGAFHTSGGGVAGPPSFSISELDAMRIAHDRSEICPLYGSVIAAASSGAAVGAVVGKFIAVRCGL